MYYSVANFPFRIILPEGWDADVLLPSFRPFLIEKTDAPLFTLTVVNGERESLRSGDGSRVTGEGVACGRVRGEQTFLCHPDDRREEGSRISDERLEVNEKRVTMNNGMPNASLSPSPFTHRRQATLPPSPIAAGDPSPFTLPPSPFKKPLLEDENDMGRLRLYDHPEGYMLTLSYHEDGAQHVLLTDKLFTTSTAYVWMDDPDISMVLTSMLRIVYSQAILPHGGISLHASVVTHEGVGYLFMGVSGTGKSTHSRLWMEHVPGSELLNDDNPIVRLMEDGQTYVFGSPWSGKTPCYRAAHVPIGGIARLQQAKVNRFVKQNMVEAFSQVLPGCSVVRADARLYNALCDTLAVLCTLVNIGRMECLPDREAALQCLEGLKNVKR